MRRVVVTGMGAISPAGHTAPATWSKVALGETCLGIRQEQHPFDKPLGAVTGFDARTHFARDRLPLLDPVAQYAVVAAREAIAGSRLETLPHGGRRAACVIGTGAGCQRTFEESSRRLRPDQSGRLHPLTIPKGMFSAAASQVAFELGVRGPVHTVASACASATHAIGQAFHMVRSGQVDLALAGGSEACLEPGCLTAWQALHVLSAEACRPFSLGRTGLNLADGAAMLVLEEKEAALARGAPILGEVAGFGACSDAGSITSPDPEGMAWAMSAALSDAGVDGAAVDLVNAHGTGTELNDRTECQALRRVFGKRAEHLPVTATKSVLGHSLGASGALEAVVSICAMVDGFAPPTAGFEHTDPNCPIDCIPTIGRSLRIAHVLSNSFAFGGLNASLLLRHADA